MLLSLIFFILFFSIIFTIIIPSKKRILLQYISLLSTSFVFLLSIIILITFDCNNYYFQKIITYKFDFNFLNLYFSFGLDGISLFFFVLSSLLIFLCVLFVWNETLFKEYIICLLFLDLLLLLVFSTLDLFLFYIFFEAILIPMYLIIGMWGSRERKIRAVYLFFFFYFNRLFMYANWYVIYLFYYRHIKF